MFKDDSKIGKYHKVAYLSITIITHKASDLYIMFQLNLSSGRKY